MLRALIFEDEELTANRLKKMIESISDEIEILEIIPSVKRGVEFLADEEVDLIFMDIHLSDGSCFEIFGQCEIKTPIIFTTAYDEYALRAFKLNSIDYILKPIDKSDLEKAINKYQDFFKTQKLINSDIYRKIGKEFNDTYKKRFLIKLGDQFLHIQTEDIAYFIFENGNTNIISKSGKKYILDQTLDSLESSLNPNEFFRINRKIILNINSIEKIHTYFNSRLKLEINPKSKDEIIVARDRVSRFKDWLGG